MWPRAIIREATSLLDEVPGAIHHVFAFSALCAYGGVIILGIPIYLFLRAHEVTAFWIAPAVGFVVGQS